MTRERPSGYRKASMMCCASCWYGEMSCVSCALLCTYPENEPGGVVKE